MPTIRRPPTPSWRSRKFFGHACETLITRSTLDLECDRWFHGSDLTDAARELLLKLSLTAWFVRIPGERQHFATLVKLTGHHPPSQALRDAAGYVPLTASSVRGDGQHIGSATWHYSFIAGKAQAYLNGNPKWCWDGLKPHLEMMAMPPEDRDAFKDI